MEFHTRSIAVLNQKGGVGKSTLAVHLAVWLHDRGAKVALLDLDKQRSSSFWTAQAEPKITVRTATTPEECLSELQNLAACHDFVVGDGPGGLDDVSRTLLILADLALLPITPSILDLWSVQQATTVLRYAQKINEGPPVGRLILNKMRTRDTISRELKSALANRRLTIWGPNPANPCGRLIKFEVLPVNLDRVEIAGPRTARAEEIKPRSFAEADLPILAAMHYLITGPKHMSISAAAREMVAEETVLKLGTNESVVERLRRLHPEIPK
jgi:chromosome partitioning protein